MHTIGEFFAFAEENGIGDDAELYLYEPDDDVLEACSMVMSDPYGSYSGWVGLSVRSKAAGGTLTVGDVREFVSEDGIGCPLDIPLLVDFDAGREWEDVDGFSFGDPPLDGIYVVFS